jgi:hypothetical protein
VILRKSPPSLRTLRLERVLVSSGRVGGECPEFFDEMDMTQVIACSSPDGIVLATDSCATWFDPVAGMRHFHLKKLLQMGSHSSLVSAGAGIGAEMGSAFQQFIQRRQVEGIEEIVRLALPFLNDQYGQYLRGRTVEPFPYPAGGEGENEEDLPSSGIYFILSGYSFRSRHQPYPLCLIGNEADGMPMRSYPTSRIIVIPRSLSMEKRVEDELQKRLPLDHLLSLCRSFLEKRSLEEEVGPPFHFATITPAGFKEIINEEVEK